MRVSIICQFFFLAISTLVLNEPIQSQPLTGVWHGKISKQAGLLNRSTQLELKLIRDGDSLTGTSYYYTNDNHYSRFQIKGYVNPFDGTVIWWDENPIDQNGKASANNQTYTAQLYYVTDFNCPGEGIMKLDGEADKKSQPEKNKIPVHLNKVDNPLFADEWDYVLENFSRGASEPAIIDSIEQLSVTTNKTPEPVVSLKQVPVTVTRPAANTVEEMLVSRKKILVTEIPISGDTIELRFYDHAEIDGDSIALFLNNQLLQKNILLKASPYTVKIPVANLGDTNELIMVAENLGSIPPNTSLMIAYINDIRYEARLESTENSSAMIRFYKPVQAAKVSIK